MTRHIVLGNQSMLVNIDKWLQIRDIYFPYVGLENHLMGHAMRIGVFADGKLSWVNEEGWVRKLRYRDDTLTTNNSAVNSKIGVELSFAENIHHEANILIRKITVRNTFDNEREIKIFFNNHLHLYGDGIGDTAVYQMDRNVVIHYKRSRYVLIGVLKTAVPQDIRSDIDDYAIGQAEEKNAEGTYRDAEDGVLSKNPVAQGSVDSTVGVSLKLAGRTETTIYYYLAAGKDFKQVYELHDLVYIEGPEGIMSIAEKNQEEWLGKTSADLSGLDAPLAKLFKRSLLIIKTQTDIGGAILAANDSDIMQFNRDTYSYMWARDASLVAASLIDAGYAEFTKPFFTFCRNALWGDKCLLHKYNPDGTLGCSWHPWVEFGKPALPIQEDETALVLYALWKYYERTGDVAFIREMYDPYVKKAAEFMDEYTYPNGLPRESYDLWEERRGIFAFTCSAVYAGLVAAEKMAHLMKDEKTAAKCGVRHEKLRKAIIRELFDRENDIYARGISYENGDTERKTIDATADSSVYALFEYNVLQADDARIVKTMENVLSRLWINNGIGGLARYEADKYQRRTDEATGNPWLISTLWLAKWHIAKAKDHKSLEEAYKLIKWSADRATETGIMPEQVHPKTGEPLSVAPLTWSHSEYIDTIMKYQKKKRELKEAR